jgi:hypothetical protein
MIKFLCYICLTLVFIDQIRTGYNANKENYSEGINIFGAITSGIMFLFPLWYLGLFND